MKDLYSVPHSLRQIFLRVIVASLFVLTTTLHAIPALAAIPEAQCSQSDDCKEFGMCHSSGNLCIAMSDSDCAQTRVCLQNGFCSAFEGKCVKGSGPAQASKSREDCRSAGGTWHEGVRDFGRQGDCSLPAPETGKACTTAKDCVADCIQNVCSQYPGRPTD